jgi:ferredoxin/flavodoxin---NADP+ reductase
MTQQMKMGEQLNQIRRVHLSDYIVAVIGAGPAGLYASNELASSGVHVLLFNRDIKPGGLAEYGIYHDKYKMKDGLRRQFRQILDTPEIEYYGNLIVGEKGDITIPELKTLGFHALLITVGAQGTKWLGLPGEELQGVYHAKDLVYHYNHLPPYSVRRFPIGKRVAVIGVGNVMVDIAHWLVRDLKVDEVIAVARRGPAEVKFTRKELESIACNLDQQDLDAEIERVSRVMRAVGQDPQQAKEFILSSLPKAMQPNSHTRFRFEFLASPHRILGGERGVVRGLEIEDTTLVTSDGDTKAKRLGTTRVLDVDTVIFCIGDRVDEDFGLPVRWNAFVKNPEPRFPVDGVSYEAHDPELGRPIERVFVAGWSREASSGLVGVARKDGERGARAVLAYLASLSEVKDRQEILQDFYAHLRQLNKQIVRKDDLVKLEQAERQVAEERGLVEFKFDSNEEMLEAIRREVAGV